MGGGSAEATRKFVESERSMWGKVIKATGVPQQ
jgi:hypothetical protein